MKALLRLLPLVTVVALGLPAQAEPVHFRLSGSEGNGLLPGNGVGGAGFANAKDSSATGGLINPRSLYYEPESQRLVFDFAFQDLSVGGLFRPAVHGGIHLHGPTPPSQPGANAGVLYILNTTAAVQPGLKLQRGPLREGVTAGRLTGSVVIQKKDLKALLDGQTYLNIHSKRFPNGEIRGSLLSLTP